MSLIYFILLLTLLAGSFGVQMKTWSLFELSEAVESRFKDDIPIDAQSEGLVEALNQIMTALLANRHKEVTALIKSPTGNNSWTVAQLEEAVINKNVSPDLAPFVKQTFQNVITEIALGTVINATEVEVPALDISVWTRAEIENALLDPELGHQLIPYIMQAKKELDTSLQDTISLITPVGIVPHYNKDAIIVPKGD